MRSLILVLIFVSAAALQAQDKIYLLDGSSRNCKIKTIDSDYLFIEDKNEEITISKLDILLIEFKNGSIEIINLAQNNATYSPNMQLEFPDKSKRDKYKNSFASLNTLALCNADVSAFYEFMPQNIPLSFGVMGAYNFNLQATLQNIFIVSLSNAKKNYDAGVYVNYFLPGYTKEMQVYVGLMIKYTDFSFNKSINTGIPGTNASSITYKATKGNQLATLITAGTHTYLNDRFFVKTIAGIGAFKLKGDYKREYNLQINNNGSGAGSFNFLPKMYLGINIGYNF